jgi:putative glutamine amidotransferase
MQRMKQSSQRARPIIGITADVDGERSSVMLSYADAVGGAGGLPMILPPQPDLAHAFVQRCDGIVLSGGDDPIMERWGIPTHPEARRVSEIRQEFELAVLAALDDQPQLPVLGICLGMQYMALHAGACLDQCLPESLPTHAMHAGKVMHVVDGELGRGSVLSNHRQAVVASSGHAGLAPLHVADRLRVVATAPDGVIEAIRRDDRPFYVGVQWHPERTTDARLGRGLFHQLVEACRLQPIA